MKIKLMINNKEIVADISNNDYELLTQNSRETGRERSENYLCLIENNLFGCDAISCVNDDHTSFDDRAYATGNYYANTDKGRKLSARDSKAIRLYLKMQKYADINNQSDIDWDNYHQFKYYIVYNHKLKDFQISSSNKTSVANNIYFTSYELADLAIENFKTELIELIN